jgi:large subunit ribosomal protein L24
MHVRKGDTVVVTTGDDAGSSGRVLRVLADKNKVVVEGINRAYKHMKPSRRNPQGGRLSKEMAVSAANVLLWCPTCRRGVRTGRRYDASGAKERFCKKCSASLGALSKPRARYATK